MLRSAVKKIAISALGISVGLFITQSSSRAQDSQVKQKDAAAAAVPLVLQNYSPVTAERLEHPADGDWLMIRRTYNGWGYSPLDQINTTNVSKLRLVWSTITGESRVYEAAPVVNDGVMFISTPHGQVIAFDAKTGDILWRYRKPRPKGAVVLHDVSRGVALYGDKVYYAAGEAELVALDAKTGAPVWTATVADSKAAYYITLAPLIAGGKVMVGASGGETGIRGFIAAYDPDTGKQLWRTYTIPAPGQPGSETWPKGDQWKHGGGPVWVTGNYDPDTNTAYWGVGNGGPWMGDKRPGDNLYTASTLAIDVATGAIKGYFQYTPNESWDWDEVSPPILVDYQRSGRTVKGLIDVARNGYLYFLDRTNGGAIRFVEGKPYVYQNVFRGLDPVTGRPDVDAAHKPGTNKHAEFCPGSHGGKNWPPVAYSPQTRMIYIPANDNICGAITGKEEVTYVPGKNYAGIVFRHGPLVQPKATDHFGEVQAWNVDTGQQVWKHQFEKSPNWGSMLATAGGLVISGGTNDRMVRAFDASDGKVLWEFPTSSGIEAPVTTYLIDGTQYLAVLSGWGGDANGANNTVARTVSGVRSAPEGGSVWVFALK
ncbi:MAG TPA: PQQ-dependent dehydrogenase, methanol/ethanol family [Bryobacteraceae bacterium]|nr:PQQ-dependent dehydrogenase, methanol/ethanol family [Bryobacteraceae bacterium]